MSKRSDKLRRLLNPLVRRLTDEKALFKGGRSNSNFAKLVDAAAKEAVLSGKQGRNIIPFRPRRGKK